MYCSLEDAWGDNLTSSQNNILTNNLDPYSFNTNENYQSIEKQDVPETQLVEPVIENYENHNNKCLEKIDCHDIVDKILACPTCKSILMNKLNNSNSFDSFNLSFLKNNQEVIVLLVVIVIIIIIIDFIIQGFKK